MTYDNPKKILVSKILNSMRIISIFINYDSARKQKGDSLIFPKCYGLFHFSELEDIWLSFTCSTDLQNFRSCFKKI